jgi:hypothetical protein
MKFPEFKYVDFALGGVNHRNNVVLITEAAETVRGKDCEAYCTVCRFPDDYSEHVTKLGSVRGYAGPAYADFLPFDVDREGDLGTAQQGAVKLAEHVQASFRVEPSALRYFFSGAKGFHLLVPAALLDARPADDLPRRFKAMAFAIAGAADVVIDRAVYDVNRLLRMPNTRNPKSGLFKIELGWGELVGLSIEELRTLAAAPREFQRPRANGVRNEGLAGLYMTALGAEQERRQASGVGNNRVVEILQAAYQPGRRHGLVLALAGFAAKHSIPRERVLGIVEALSAGDEEQADRLRAASDTFDRLRSGDEVVGWSDLLRLLGDARARELARLLGVGRETYGAANLEHVYDAEAAGRRYFALMKRVDSRRVRTGIPTLDAAIRGLIPGTVAIGLAKARVGKSLFVQHLRRHVAAQMPEAASVLFSLEMPIELVWERDAQFVLDLAGDEIERRARGASDEEARRMIAQVSDRLPGAVTVAQPGVTLEGIAEYCRLIEEKFGRRVGLVLIDYLSLVRAEGRDLYTVTTTIARGLKPLALTLDCPVFMVAQVNRGSGDGTKPPTLEDGRDSGAIEEGADVVIGAHRPRLDAENDDEIVLTLLKNRFGRAGVTIRCCVDWRRMAIGERAEGANPEEGYL